MNKQEFMVCYDEASRRLDREIEDLKERLSEIEAHRHVLDAARDAFIQSDKLNDKLEQKQQEVDDLEEQLEAKQTEKDTMLREMQAENDDLCRQLLEAQNAKLNSEKQHLVAEVHAKPMEIHNHFEPGSSSQVFNDKVNGRFAKLVKKDNKEKKDRKRWKRMVKKVL